MIQTRCRYFNGYKPCGKNENCSEACSSKDLVQSSVLIVHLGAIGAVVRSTALLKLIRAKHPDCHLTWVTDAPADQILRGHPDLDRVLSTSHEGLLQLKALHFDVAYVIDKSLKAAGVLRSTRVGQILGFQVDAMTGAILPATEATEELWQLGLNDHQKFFGNQKSEVQLMIEALELQKFQTGASDYNLPLTAIEQSLRDKRHQEWTLRTDQPVIGFNTGCSSVIAAKKWTVEYHRQVIRTLLNRGFENIVLLGGPEDSERNFQIGQGLPVFQSETTRGLRDGLVSVAACDIVLTGDSLGMHMAISQEKFVIAWFGPTCHQEIELYGRGEKILTEAACSPCWKRSCEQKQMCYDQVSLKKVLQAVDRGLSQWQQRNGFLSFKPLF